jgi:two-component system chemotaxis sensor kinase CheA
VEEGRLDALLDAIGEMVIAESMVSASTRGGTDAAVLELQVERLDKITRELQQMATSLRMMPLRTTFRRMARLVRDVANKNGKLVDFVLVGEDTELDKVVVDRISDPLVHALRNAVDHGIETPAERRAAGKPEVGRVELRASHTGGAIHVEITDDGRGLDTERILATARERGLVTEDEMLDEKSIADLVYAPGFSTAEKVTDVSGRGVGMDVVKRTVEELRGRVELRSVAGEGTTLEIRLPLTLAIIDGMILRVGAERYVLPLIAIERSVRPRADQIASVTGRGQMLSLPEGLVPVIRLHELFSTPDAETDLTQSVVVIVDDNGTRAGLLACELLGQQQTVIKPLGEGLPQQLGIAGGAIMPDGRVGLILDAAGLVRTAQLAGGE